MSNELAKLRAALEKVTYSFDGRERMRAALDEYESALQPSLPQDVPVDKNGFACTGNAEADAVINRLSSSDPDFDDCSAAVALIYRLIAEIKGPDGFATWKDAAIHERLQRRALPQDVEEWIDNNQVIAHNDNGKGEAIVMTSDLRAFLAGKVLVEIDVIERALTAIRNELESAHEQAFPVCCGRRGEECCGSPDPDWPDTAKATMENLGSVEKELAAMLTASKGECEECKLPRGQKTGPYCVSCNRINGG